VVRHKFIKGRGRGAQGKVVAIGKALAHVRYIQHRPGPDRDPGGRELFSEAEDHVDSKEMRKLIKELGDSRVVIHKLTLAPEINPEDKKAFTREVMQQLGRDKGQDLQWFATKHDNTEHHHIHVVLLGRDQNGTEVRIDLKDIDKVKEYGERYLERCHPLELERSRSKRKAREKDRMEQRRLEQEAARNERIRDGLELPWMHQKIVREVLEPYGQWRQKQDRKLREPEKGEREVERPYHQDTIEAAGKEWSKANRLEELRELNEHLWDNYEDRLPKEEYKKLVAWIHEKERLGERKQGLKAEKAQKEDGNSFEHKGEKYSKEDSYEKLTGLSAKLREDKEKLPFEDYQSLRGWIENRDRERWSGVVEKQVELSKAKFDREAKNNMSPTAGRWVDAVQLDVMRNPIVGLFMMEASIASTIVKMIPLDDRNRDYAKEQIAGLEEAKKNLDEREKERSGKALENMQMPWEFKAQEERDREAREKIEKAKEETERKRAEELERKKRDREDKERDDPFSRDQWGRW